MNNRTGDWVDFRDNWDVAANFARASANMHAIIDELGDSFPSWTQAEAPQNPATADQANRIIELLERLDRRLAKAFP
jgi:hypothetical protein